MDHTSFVENKRNLTPDEAELWREFKGGNKWALSCIYRQYVRMLYNYGTRLSADDGLIEDCIQDLFIDLWRNRAGLSDTDSIKYYLFRSLRRRIARKAHKKLSQHTQLGEVPEAYDRETAHSAETELIHEQTLQARKEHLQAALNHLSQRQREAIFLRYYADMSPQEIAQIMSLNYQSACNLLHRALTALKQHVIYTLH